MNKFNLKIDNNVSFSEDLSVIDEFTKGTSPQISHKIYETIIPEKKNKTLMVFIVIFTMIMLYQLQYLVGVYIERDNLKIEKEKNKKAKEFNEKQNALMTQSKNFSRDAKNTLDNVQKIIAQVHAIKKDKIFIPNNFNEAKIMYDSAMFYLNQNQYAKASKFAITSINSGNVAMTYAETELNDLLKQADEKVKEDENLKEKIKKKREEIRHAIDQAKEALKVAGKNNSEKFSPITFEEAKRLLLKAVNIFNSTIDSKDLNEINKALEMAKKAESMSKLANEETEKNREKFTEEIKRKKALEDVLKSIDNLGKTKKDKTKK